MTYLMDVVTEDTFYENLTLGLTKILEHSPKVTGVELDKRLPCERMQLSSWEQRHCCILPQDLRQFYLSTDGFLLTWKYEYAGDILNIGNMKISSITELKRLGGVKTQGDSDCPSLLDIEVCNAKNDGVRPHFGVKCKIFELDSCQGNGRVCLVYHDKNETDIERREKPRIWLLDRSFEWHFLSDSFSQYFRMMLVHQGLPQWQFRFTPMGLTPFAEQIMMLIAPHLLQPDGLNVHTEWADGPFNHLDSSVFKNSRSKSSKKKESKGRVNQV